LLNAIVIDLDKETGKEDSQAAYTKQWKTEAPQIDAVIAQSSSGLGFE
jgi:hypothetical protein